jgi:hypothetical protein
MKPRHVAMGVALLGAAGLVVFGDKAPSGGVVESVERVPRPAAPAPAPAPQPAARAATPAAAVAAAGPAPAILPLIPRAQLIGEAGDGAFKSADGVFGGQTWNPPPPSPPPAAAAPPPPPPSAPPLPFTVIGKAAADGQWEVFLARGADQTFVVRKHTVIDGMYRVETIAPPTMTMTYLPMNQVQQLNIGVIE